MSEAEQAQGKETLPGIARKMVERGFLSESDAMLVLKNARSENRSFYLQSITQNIIPVSQASQIAAAEFGFPLLDLDSINMQLAPTQLVSDKVIEKNRVLPLFMRGQKLFVGVSDPSNRAAIDEIKFSTGLRIKPVLVDPKKLDSMIDSMIEPDTDVTLSDIVEEGNLGDIDLTEETEEQQGIDSADLLIDAPIVRFVNKILQDAIHKLASDIHIEPYERMTRIRFRIDGVLHDAINPPLGLIHKIIARLKILSKLDIAERRLPQDGRMKLTFSRNRSIDFRVNTMPTLFGEKMVIRVLDTSVTNLGIDMIGMTDSQLALYREAAFQPHGMILVTGPTGSGKTISLYSALSILNTPERNISSVEDPVEINVSGINQVNINEKAGLTFAVTLRAFLRQDPDVLMVGEIRDLETAEIAIKAAQTGHMVFSTLHTNDAPSTVTRLINMGVAPFNIVSSVNLIIAQRLVRRLCESCRRIASYPEEVLLQAGFREQDLDSLEIYEPSGCAACTLGYRGRTGIFEVMPLSNRISELVMKRASTLEIEQAAKEEGILSTRDAGLAKVARGITSLEEVERVTKD